MMRNRKRLMGSTALYSRMFLRAPDDIIDNGDDDSGNPGGGGKQQQQTQQKVVPPKNDDDLGLEDVFTADSDDGSFELPEDDEGEESDDDKATAAAAQEEVKSKLSGILTGFQITEADIPDELGFGDKGKAAEFMTKQFQRGLNTSLQLMLPTINHALTIAVKQLDKKIGSSVKQTGTQMEAQKAFSGLGYTGSDSAFAKTIFNKALKERKMTPAQAATATRNAMKALGKSGTPSQNNGRRQSNGDASQTRHGEEALNGFFSD